MNVALIPITNTTPVNNTSTNSTTGGGGGGSGGSGTGGVVNTTGGNVSGSTFFNGTFLNRGTLPSCSVTLALGEFFTFSSFNITMAIVNIDVNSSGKSATVLVKGEQYGGIFSYPSGFNFNRQPGYSESNYTVVKSSGGTWSPYIVSRGSYSSGQYNLTVNVALQNGSMNKTVKIQMI